MPIERAKTMRGWGKLPLHHLHIERRPKNLRQMKQLLQYNAVHYTEFNEETYRLLKKLSKTYGLPRMGYTRACFRVGNGWVLKVAFNMAGVNQCHREVGHFEYYSATGWGTPIPRTQWADLSALPGGVRHASIYAEEVRIASAEEVHQWQCSGFIAAHFPNVDAQQIGVTYNGQVVAYDL